MIVVRIELWPHGDKKRAREIGRAVIANVGGNSDVAEYDATIELERSGRMELVGDATVKDFPRKKLGPWHLLFEVLRRALE